MTTTGARPMLLFLALLLPACVSPRYRAAPKDTPEPQILDVRFPSERLDANLRSVITYNGPGSWKRNACWDEYVVTVRNSGDVPVTIATVTLTDPAGTRRAAGVAPWALEKESQQLEKNYRASGIAFVRYTAPGLAIIGGGAAAIAATGVFSAASAAAAVATVVALPAYYISVVSINHMNKAEMERQFRQRRLVTPLTLAPGESRTASVFFPMVPSPRTLSVGWSDAAAAGEAALELPFLRDLHVKTDAKSQ